MGSWTGSSKAFEVIYMILWYLGPMNHFSVLDFIGTTDSVSLTWLYEVLSLIFLTAGMVGRWKQLSEV